MKDLKFHPAADIFPLMDDEPFDELVENIKEHGLQVPIELYEGLILDGRNRYRACLLAGSAMDFIAVDGRVDDPVAHVLSLNKHRRHLKPSQLAVVAAKARKFYDAQAKERQKRKPADSVPVVLPEQTGDARDLAGKAVGVSGSLVDRGTKVVESAKVGGKGAKAVLKAVEEGRMSVTAAALLAESPDDVQERVAKEAKFAGGRFRNGKSGSQDLSTINGAPKNIKRLNAAMQKAEAAISMLSGIRKDDPDRDKALAKVSKWIEHERKV